MAKTKTLPDKKTTEQLISELLDQRNIFEDALRKIRDTTWCVCKSGKDCPYCLAKNATDLAYQAKVATAGKLAEG